MNNVYSVTQVNSYIKDMFTNDYALTRISVKGEVSNCKYHTSGHIYFTLKDEQGQIACVLFATHRSGLKFKLLEGQSVIVLGSVSVYERDGKYQLYAREIVADGVGILYQQYEKLKQDLEEQGYFDPMYKSPIPKYPNRVGIVTSKTGAAIQDIKKVLLRRNPYIQIVLYNALVQGEGSKESIVKGIEVLDNSNVDTIIIGRGGGSMEDLWAFNEEIVVKAIYNCNTPIISAVGHETDVTLSDFVSDLRAPTPSAAAELATGNITELIERFFEYKQSLSSRLTRKISEYRQKVQIYKIRTEHFNPLHTVRVKRQQAADYEEKLNLILKQKITEKRHKLEIYIEKINALSPLTKLTKGYSFVTDKNNAPIKTINQVKDMDLVRVQLIDGEFTARVEDVKLGGNRFEN